MEVLTLANVLSQEILLQRISNNFKQNVILIGKYKNRREKVELCCQDCNHQWFASPSTFLYGFNCECPNCGDHAPNKIKVKCEYCGKIIFRHPSDIKNNQTGKFYCSHECGNRYKANQMHTPESNNYRLKAMNQHNHICACCGWNEDERILEVHHIDDNRSHNEIENLIILCPICHRKITLGYYKLIDKQLIKI